MNYRDYAVRILKHYMSQVYRTAGLRWESDMDAEMEALVDAIISASTKKDNMEWLNDALNSGDGTYKP